MSYTYNIVAGGKYCFSRCCECENSSSWQKPGLPVEEINAKVIHRIFCSQAKKESIPRSSIPSPSAGVQKACASRSSLPSPVAEEKSCANKGCNKPSLDAKVFFAAVGIKDASKECEHGMPFYACMSCSH